VGMLGEKQERCQRQRNSYTVIIFQFNISRSHLLRRKGGVTSNFTVLYSFFLETGRENTFVVVAFKENAHGVVFAPPPPPRPLSLLGEKVSVSSTTLFWEAGTVIPSERGGR